MELSVDFYKWLCPSILDDTKLFLKGRSVFFFILDSSSPILAEHFVLSWLIAATDSEFKPTIA